MATIHFRFTKDGKSKIDAEGFTGTTCQDATKFFEEALGKVTANQAKPELYETAAVSDQLSVQGAG